MQRLFVIGFAGRGIEAVGTMAAAGFAAIAAFFQVVRSEDNQSFIEVIVNAFN